MPRAETTVPCAAPVAQSPPAGSKASPTSAVSLTRPWPPRTAPRGRAGHRPLHLQGRLTAPPWPRPRGGEGTGASAGHRISCSDAPQVSSGHQTSCKRFSLDSARQLGDKSGCHSTLGAPPCHLFAPTSPAFPGGLTPTVPRAGPLNRWPSGAGVLQSHLSGALLDPPRPAGRNAPGLGAVRPHSTPAAYGSGWRGRQEPSPGAPQAPSGFLGSARPFPRGVPLPASSSEAAFPSPLLEKSSRRPRPSALPD